MPDVRLRKSNIPDVTVTENLPQGNTTDLVNKDLVRAWLWWSIGWLTIFPLVGDTNVGTMRMN